MRSLSTALDLLLTQLQEKRRQKHFINLIPSENFTSQAVLDALGSVMQSELRNACKYPLNPITDRLP